MIAKIAIAFLTSLSASVMAQQVSRTTAPPAAAQPPAANLGDALSRGIGVGADQIKQSKRLPVQGMSLIETTDGKTFVVSDNGRLAIIGGRVIDLWKAREIRSIADSESLDRIDLQRMGIKASDLTRLSVGTGPERVTVFVDPICDPCRQLISDMERFTSTHTFDIVVYPVQGGPSGAASRRIHCSSSPSLALKAMAAGSYTSLPEPAKDCDVNPVQKALITGAVLGIRSVPFLIFKDGTSAYGSSLSLASSLKR